MIDLLYSCPEDFDKMNPTKCGVYCDACKKEVIDFRGKSLEEIEAYSLENPGRTCGIFDAYMVKENSRTTVQNIFRIAFAAVFIFGLNTSIVFGQREVQFEEPSIVQVEEEPSKTAFISGKIMNKRGKGIKGSIMWYDETGRVVIESDDKGNFYFEFPERMMGKKISLSIRAEEKKTEYITIEALSNKCYTYEVRLEKKKKVKYRRRHMMYGAYAYDHHRKASSDKSTF